MNIQKAMQRLGFSPEDFSLEESTITMTPKFETKAITPVELDEDNLPITEQIDVTPSVPNQEQLFLADEEVQLQERDIALLINAYLADKQRDAENDTLNIVDGLIYSWNFTHAVKPSNTELLALKEAAYAFINQEAINAEALAYLSSTDWYIIRSQETGESIPTDVLVKRAQARIKVIR